MAAITKDEIIKRDARVCACGKHPAWAKIRGGIILACPDITCGLYLAVRGPCLSDAIQNWNQGVSDRDAVRKRH